MSPAGTTGLEPAISGLTGRHVHHYTTPPVQRRIYHNSQRSSNPWPFYATQYTLAATLFLWLDVDQYLAETGYLRVDALFRRLGKSVRLGDWHLWIGVDMKHHIVAIHRRAHVNPVRAAQARYTAHNRLYAGL
jgi:hypothetical protein